MCLVKIKLVEGVSPHNWSNSVIVVSVIVAMMQILAMFD